MIAEQHKLSNLVVRFVIYISNVMVFEEYFNYEYIESKYSSRQHSKQKQTQIMSFGCAVKELILCNQCLLQMYDHDLINNLS